MSDGVENLEGGSTEQQQEQQLSPVEQRAIELGWKPKEEFTGDEASFIPADEFVRRQPLFERIEAQSKQVKNLHKALDALKSHFTTVREAEYNRALKALKNERREALVSGDADKFEQLDDQITEVETEAKKLREVDIAPIEQEKQVHPDFVNWTARNPWYTTTGYMRAFADDYGTKLAAQGMSPPEVLKAVEAAVRKEFPNKFTNPNKANAPHSESPGSSTRKTSGDIELTEQERNIMNTLVRSGTLTKEEYLKQLKEVKGSR